MAAANKSATLDLDADGIVRRVREGFPELFSTAPSGKEMAKTASDRS